MQMKRCIGEIWEEGAQNIHALFVCTTFQEPPGVQLSGSSRNLVLLGFYEDFIA